MQRLVQILVFCLAATLTASCGPRAGGGGGGVNKGSPPSIFYNGSQFKSPEWVFEAGDVLFPALFNLHASDVDGDMRRVEITVSYRESCSDTDTVWVLDPEPLPLDLWTKEEITMVNVITTDQVRVPQDCYPLDSIFVFTGKVVDFHGNPSINNMQDGVEITASQNGNSP
ncbi:MAG: hypothetical protein ACE5FN_11600 [Leptospirillia bacterium]